MTDHDEFDRSLPERLRAHESRVPGAEAPDLDAARSGGSRERRNDGGWGALVVIAAGAVGLLLAFAISGRLSPPTGQSTETPSPTFPQPAGHYEAVFLRNDMVVIGIDAEGHEHEIARPGNGGTSYWPASPAGAVTPTGLLAVAVGGPGGVFHWEILDLRHASADPLLVAGIEQDADQLPRPPYYTPEARPGVVWGPGERVAIGWYERGAGTVHAHVSFVDGHTGEASSVDVPDGYEILPYWASDGSGIFVAQQTQAGSNVLSLLRPDGTIASGDTGMIDSGYGRRYRSDGVEVNGADLSLSGLDISDLAWTADGDGAWLAVRSPADGHQLTLERLVLPSQRRTMATIHDAVGEPAASRPEGHLVGLAPDDSMIVLSMDSVIESVDGSSTEPRPRVLVNPESGASFVIEGSFVGWLEADQ